MIGIAYTVPKNIGHELEDSIRKFILTLMMIFRNIRQWRQLNKKQHGKDGKEKEKEVEVDKNSEEKEQDGESKENDSEKETNKESEDEVTKKVTDDMDIMDNTECKFNVNSFKMVYVVNSESYLYKRMALNRAKEVSIYFTR